ncbi:MAG: hypothetical protein CL678_07695 [Bdellovibrionaceae bacterium]|nr:hypothetical protein [Pseudobdellovibrionaceae bacterium]
MNFSSKKENELWDYFQQNDISVFSNNHMRHEKLVEFAKKGMPTNSSLLNIGAGDGYLESYALKNGFRVSSCDPSSKTMEILKEKKIDARVGSADQIPFEDEVFDVVIATEIFEHLTEKEFKKALKEVKRVLKPNGLLVGTVPFQENLSENEVYCPHCSNRFHRWGHFQTFKESDICNLLSLDFTNIYTGKRTYVIFRGRNFFGKIKSLIRSILGRLGSPMAYPKIFFHARRS